MHEKIKNKQETNKHTDRVQMMNNLNLDNLVHIKITNKIGLETRTTIRLAMLNVTSVENKNIIIVKESIKNRIDMTTHWNMA